MHSVSWGNLATNVAVCAILVLLLILREPFAVARRRSHWRVLSCILVSVLMAVLFLTANVRVTFGDLFPTRPQLVIYTVIFCLYLAVAMVDVLRLAVAQIPAVRRTHLAPALSLAAIGAGVYLAYCLYKVVGAVYGFVAKTPNVGESSGLCQSPVQSVACTMTISCPLAAALLLLAGVAFPHWWPVVSALPRRTRYRRDIAALSPLWTPLVAGGLAHELPRGEGATGPVYAPSSANQFDLGQQRYRRLIEVRDGLSALADYQQRSDAARAEELAAGRGDQDPEIVREAARTHLALAHHRGDERGDMDDPPPLVRTDAKDLEADVRHLVQIAGTLAVLEQATVER